MSNTSIDQEAINRKKANVRSGFSLSITCLIVAIILAFKPDYFGSLTTFVRLIFIVFGFMGLGVDLNKLSSKQENFYADYERGAGIFDNIGIGIGFIITWTALSFYFPFIWVNVLTLLVLMFGISAVILGIFNGLLESALLRRDLQNQKIDLQEEPSKREAMKHYNSDRIFINVRSSIIVGAGIVGFLASALTILDLLKILG